MGFPVKLPDEVLRAAETEAEAAHRSLPAQIEHWVAIGRAAEAILSQAEVMALKQRLAAQAQGEAQTLVQKASSILMAIARSSDRSSVLAAIRASGDPLYESDPNHPGLIVQVEANGRRTLGRFGHKRFIPIAEPQAAAR